MKTTLDLPDDLVRQLKFRALSDGRSLKDLVADMLRDSLTAPPKEAAIIVEERGLPVVRAQYKVHPGQEMTPEKIADLLLEQEVEWFLGPR